MIPIRHFIEEHKYFFIIVSIGIMVHLGVFITLKSIAVAHPKSLNNMFPIMGGGFDSTHYSTLPDNILKYGNFSLQPGSNGNPETFRTPAYPFFVAIIKYLTGGINAVPIFQILLLAFSAYFAYIISLSIAPAYKKIALATTVFFMFDPVSFFATQFLATESLYTFFFLLCIYFLVKKSRSQAQAFGMAGLFYGFSTLTRPSGLYMIIPIGLWFIWRLFHDQNKRILCMHIGIFCIITAIVLGPWYIRNGIRTGVYSLSSLEAYNTLNFNLPVYLSYESEYQLSIEDVRTELHNKIGNISDDEQLDLRNSPMIKKVVWNEIKPHLFGYAFFHISKSMNFFFSSSLKHNASILRGFWEGQPQEDWHTQTSLINSIIDGRLKDVMVWLYTNIIYFPENVFLVCLFLLGLYWSIVSKSSNARLLFCFILFLGILTSPITNPRYRAPIVPFIYFSGFMGGALLIEKLKRKKPILETP
ncbi:MAG: glycosyltransferase family 39 protein [Patescibacteria group bacterium]